MTEIIALTKQSLLAEEYFPRQGMYELALIKGVVNAPPFVLIADGGVGRQCFEDPSQFLDVGLDDPLLVEALELAHQALCGHGPSLQRCPYAQCVLD